MSMIDRARPRPHAAAPVGGKLVTPFTLFLCFLVLVGGFFVAKRFIYGFEAAAAINDGYTWGIWIAWDVVIGTAFACGGYSMALLVYVFNKGEYHPLVRPALLASMWGYTLGALSVMIDLGRWWNAWHVFWPTYGQPNSVMFEVGVCVTLYCLVLWIEFSPAFLDKLGLSGLKKKIEKAMFFFIAVGVLLPSMHQSSLGTLMVVFGHMVHPLWQTTLLPLLFLTSAITMGFCVVIFESSMAHAGLKRPHEEEIAFDDETTPDPGFEHHGEGAILGKMAGVIIALLGFYLLVRFADLGWDGKLGLLFVPEMITLFFWAEIALFAAPIVMLWDKKKRTDARTLFIAAVCMLAAGSLYRIDTFLVALRPAEGWTYFPSAPEILITLGIIAFEFLAYIVLARILPVLPHQPRPARVAQPVPAE